MIWQFPKNGTLFIAKNDLITPCGMNEKNSLHDHTMFVWFTPTKLHDHSMPLYNHTMFVWFAPSTISSHPKTVLFIPTRFVFTSCKFCSHRQDFIHTMKCLFSHTPISDHTLQTWFTPSRPWQLPIQLTLSDATISPACEVGEPCPR